MAEKDEASTQNSGFIRIKNPDAPLFRIFPLWFFEESLRLRQLALVRPEAWEDPYELLAMTIVLEREVDGRITQEQLVHHLKTLYAQCWSRTGESDTLLRAYSRVTKDSHHHRNTMPREEGVRVRSTAKKLLAAFRAWADQREVAGYFVGAVNYGTEEQVKTWAANVASYHATTLVDARGHAELALVKRRTFAHESEVRLVYVESRDIAPPKIFQLPIDPNEVFDDVAFDPRLVLFERREREATAQQLGYTGPFSDIGTYQKTILIVGEPPGVKFRPGSATVASDESTDGSPRATAKKTPLSDRPKPGT